MAHYTYDYSCGHGQGSIHLVGPGHERERKIAWMSQTRVCPDCYKLRAKEQDAAAEKQLTVTLVCAVDTVTLQLEATGQIEANREALKSLGYQLRDAQSGLLGMLSMSMPSRVWCIQKQVTSMKEATPWMIERTREAMALGYKLTDGLTPIDVETMRKIFAAEAEKKSEAAKRKALAAGVQAIDPAPPASPLRQRIAVLEKSPGAKWNGKLYGGKGRWNFYVNDQKHTATDAEVAEREANIAAFAAWKARHPELAKNP